VTQALTMLTPATFDAETYSTLGTPREAVRLPEELFDGTVNIPVMHQAVKAFLANQRQGNAATKIRKYVTGGNQKPWKQKGTGRARAGSTRAPHWVGGGTVFGPIPRSYAQYVPRQVRALARKSALNARARDGAVKVIDAFRYESPSTRRLLQLLTSLGVADQKVLVLTDGAQPAVYLSGRNLPRTHVMPYADVSTYHILWSDVVLIEGAAIGQTLEPLAETVPAAAAARPARARAGSATPHATAGAAKKPKTTKAPKKSKTKTSKTKKAAGSASKGRGATAKASGAAKGGAPKSKKARTAKKPAAKKKGK
jgi:large subunit ribosomal protein L4